MFWTGSFILWIGTEGIQNALAMAQPVSWAAISQTVHTRLPRIIRLTQRDIIVATVPHASDIVLRNWLWRVMGWSPNGGRKVVIFPSAYRDGDEILRAIECYQSVIRR